MLKYIFSVLLLAAVWVTIWLLGLPLWIGVVTTIVVVVVLGTVVIVQLVRARRAAREIERALAAQADQHAARARPDLAADVQALKVEFVKAIEALKTSKLGGAKKGTAALYALPWYMIIGPPGSGKSTALRESGLRFPYMSKGGGMVQGVGGTRNCHWWMTNEAVILDTAGRYTTEESDHEEWTSFLDLLKKNRPKQPINGIMVAIAVTDLADVAIDSVVAQAREIRTRIDEVMNRLEMIVPVYVLFTKCDLLPGFVETFSDLGANERHQIWGFTFPAAKKVADPAGMFAERFTELADACEKRALRRMGEERRIESRDKIYAFPQHLAPLGTNLATFVGEMLAENIYSESPIMRGAYFTSGTQEGSPIDRIMSSMAQAFGVQPRVGGTAVAVVEPKGYFLTDVFSKVIFPDKVIARRTAKHVRKRMLLVHGIGLALLGVAFALAVLPVSAFQRNSEFLSDSRAAVDTVNQHFLDKQEGKTDKIITAPQLAPLQATVDILAGWTAEGPPKLMLMGMYKGSDIYSGLRELYHTTLHEELIEKIHDQVLVSRLEAFVQKHQVTGSAAPRLEHDEAKRLLRVYLHLTGKKEEGEPGLLHGDNSTWLADELTQTWKTALQHLGEGTEDTVGYHDQMHTMIETFVSILATDDSKLFNRQPQLVTDVREILQRIDPGDELLERLIADSKQKDLDLFGLTGSKHALKHYDKRKVRGAFTRQAWNKDIRETLYMPLDDLLGADEWVVGRSRESAEEEQALVMARLRSNYFARYIAEWSRFLSAIVVEEPSNDTEALALIKDLTAGSREPFKLLSQHVRYHTDLRPPPIPQAATAETGLLDAAKEEAGARIKKKSQLANKYADRIKLPGGKTLEELDPTLKSERHVKEHFAKLSAFGAAEPLPPPPPPVEGGPPPPPPPPPAAVPLDSYHGELRTLRAALEDKVNIGDEATRKALRSAAKSARGSVDSLIIDSDTGQWQATLEKWLRPPIRAVERISSREAGASETESYCDQVVRPFDDLKGYYPFDGTTPKNVTIDSFSEFFKPDDGKVWAFYSTVLSTRVRKVHNGFEAKTAGATERNKINPKIAKFLTRAADITAVMFPGASADPKFEFSVLVDGSTGRGVDRTHFTVDGQKIVYRNTPLKFREMHWPGEDPPAGGFIKVGGIGSSGLLEMPFDWGFYKLLEAGTTKSTGEDRTFTFRWDLTDQDAGIVTIKFQPKLRDTPIFGKAERPVGLMKVFRHPDLTPPRNLFVGGKTCEK
ncbi:MAG: type VI secretion system membrane subunit TssM [Nannocystaceae bacterium]|nr:type VI secretion system membrane subunit TssM [Nannocystaceae bacterium]